MKMMNLPSAYIRVIMLSCGLYITIFGLILFVALCKSVYDPDSFILLLIGDNITPLSPLVGSSWAQAAVTFGMHSYADFYCGLTMISQKSPFKKPIPRLVTMWNTTRFLISFLWLLKIVQGLIQFNRQQGKDLTMTPCACVLVALLTIDSIIVRPLSIFVQRTIEDLQGKIPNQ